MGPRSTSDVYVLEAIDDGLSVFGESVKKVIYHSIEQKYGLKAKKIPQNLDLFHHGLREIFSEGSVVVESVIMKKAYERSGLELSESESFVHSMTKLLER